MKNILVITQKIDKDDSILGFFHTWICKLAGKVEYLTIITQEIGNYDLPENVKIYSLGKEKGKTRFHQFVVLQNLLYSILRRRCTTSIFCHMCPEYVLMAYPVSRLFEVPLFLWYTHNSSSISLHAASRLVRSVFTASLSSYPLMPEGVKSMGHGIDTEKFEFSQIPEDSVVWKIISIGRISPIKKYETIIRAVASLNKTGPFVNLTIIGPVPLASQELYRRKLQELIVQLNMETMISLKGDVPYSSIENEIEGSHMVISASESGLDKVVLEAMCCGRPVLVSDDAFRDLFQSGEERLIFKKGDSEDLACKIKELLSRDRRELVQLGKDNRDIILQHHNLEAFSVRLVNELT